MTASPSPRTTRPNSSDYVPFYVEFTGGEYDGQRLWVGTVVKQQSEANSYAASSAEYAAKALELSEGADQGYRAIVYAILSLRKGMNL